MNDHDFGRVLEVIELHSREVLEAAATMQIATVASLMISLAEKGILTPSEVSVFATRTADMCSQNLGAVKGNLSEVIDDAHRFYADELWKMAEHGIPKASGGVS